jgi:hypothetical protein
MIELFFVMKHPEFSGRGDTPLQMAVQADDAFWPMMGGASAPGSPDDFG